MGSNTTARPVRKERKGLNPKVISLDNKDNRVSKPIRSQVVGERHIFISHKIREERIAKNIVRELKPYGAGRLTFFVSEDIPAGEHWEKKVHDQLKAADYLILLYTDPGARWDWCLYETGFFMGSKGESEKKLICLHGPDVSSPGPLTAWQSVKASPNDLKKFIAEILDFNTDLVTDEKRLSEIAAKIAKLFFRKRVHRIFTKSIDLIFNHDQIKSLKLKRALPSEVKVKDNDQALALFNLEPRFDGTDWTWGEFLTRISRYLAESWTESVADSVAAAANCEGICPGLPVFISPRDHKTYCPVLSAFAFAGGEYTFKLDFVEVRDEDDPGKYPMIGPIANLMKLSQRVRFGLIELYRSQIRRLCVEDAGAEEVDLVLGRLRSAILKLNAEAMTLNIFGKENVTSAFNDPKDREAVNRIIQEWGVLRDKLFKDHMPQRNLNKVLEVLDGMRKINREFLLMLAKREQDVLFEMD